MLKLIGDGLLAIFPVAREASEYAPRSGRHRRHLMRWRRWTREPPRALRDGAACRGGQLRQYRRRRPARLHRDRARRHAHRRLEPPTKELHLAPVDRIRRRWWRRRCSRSAASATRLRRAGRRLRDRWHEPVSHDTVPTRRAGGSTAGPRRTTRAGLRPAAAAVPPGQFRLDGKRIEAKVRLVPGQVVRVPPLGDAGDGAEGRPKPARSEDKAFHPQPRRLRGRAADRAEQAGRPRRPGWQRHHRHVDGLLDALAKKGERPKLVHRLDRDTSGLLMVARTAAAARELAFAFQQHKDAQALLGHAAQGPRAQSRPDRPAAG